MHPTPSNLLDFQRSTAPCAPRPGFDHAGVMVDGGATSTTSTEVVAQTAQPSALRHRQLSRSYAPPLRTSADHEDDELMHGRIGRAAADRRALRGSRPMRPMSLGVWAVMLMVVAAVCVAVAL